MLRKLKQIMIDPEYYFDGLGACESKCSVEIFKDVGDKYYVIFTELLDNPGTSITNFIKELATKIYNIYFRSQGIDPLDDIIFIEKYEDQEEYDVVKLKYNGKQFHGPKWERVKKETIFGTEDKKKNENTI